MEALVTVPVSLSIEDFNDLYDMAGYSIGYWACASTWGGDHFRVMETDTREVFKVTRTEMLQVITEVISGKHDISNRIRESVTHAMLNSDLGDIDGYDVDALVQIACFKEIVYG